MNIMPALLFLPVFVGPATVARHNMPYQQCNKQHSLAFLAPFPDTFAPWFLRCAGRRPEGQV